MRRPYKPPTAAPQLAQPEAGGSGWVVALLLLLLTVAVGGAVCVKTGVYRQLMAKQSKAGGAGSGGSMYDSAETAVGSSL